MLRFLIALLLLTTPAHAGMVIGSGATFCSSCTPGDPADIMCDNLGGATGAYTCTWDGETENANSYLEWAAIDAGFPACPGIGSYALQMHMDDSDGISEDAYNTISVTSSSTLYTQVYILVVSEAMDLAGEYIPLLQGRNNTTTLWFVRLIDSGAALHLQLVYRDSTDTSIYRTGAPTTIVAGTAYRIGVKWVQNTAAPDGCQLYIDGNLEVSANTTTDDLPVTTLYLGSPAGQTAIDTNDITIIQFKLLEVDNDTMPGACM